MVELALLALLLAATPLRADVGPSWSPAPPPQEPSWSQPVAPVPVAMPGEPAQEPVRQTRFQQPQPPVETRQEQQIQLIPPGPEKVYRLESEASLQQRMKEEARDRGEPAVVFPDEPVLSTQTYRGRHWPERRLFVEPNFVCYQRLMFEEINSERYGWDFGAAGPFLSAAWFFKDVLLVPYHLAEDPCRCYECSAGYCLPGDPVPLFLYPPNCSLSGAAAEAVTVLAMIAIFP
jgi:hypothetical protein